MKSPDGLVKPTVVLSRCLGIEACRYNGKMIHDDFIQRLSGHVQVTSVCPELEIGLGVPRDPVHIIIRNGTTTLIQPATGKNLTHQMNKFSESFLRSLKGVDGFVLKSRSPSCGVKNVRIHNIEGKTVLKRGPGLFTSAVLEHFPNTAVEDEVQLKNPVRREHFLNRLYTLARLRKIAQNPTLGDLIRFQSSNRLLLMAYNQKELARLDNLVSNYTGPNLETLIKKYTQHLSHALSRRPRFTSHINVLLYAFGSISKQLNDQERSAFLDRLEQFQSRKINASEPLRLLRSWIFRHESQELKDQTYLNPYPSELNDLPKPSRSRALQLSLYPT